MNVYECSRRPLEELDEIVEVDFVDILTEEYLEMYALRDTVDYYESMHTDDANEDLPLDTTIELETVNAIKDWHPTIEPLEFPIIKAIPSDVKDLIPERKPLPAELKYAFLGEGEAFPVVISSILNSSQESALVDVLSRHCRAIGWSISYLKGINPLVCSHRINLEDEAKPVRQMQRRLNPVMKDVVKNEVIKLLDEGIIYPIPDSKWVSPTQVVPNKSGVTVVKNDNNELIPTRVQTGWRVCIDYRRLNAVRKKDHFPLPFLDQVLERVAGHAYYCFLDYYSGYNQIEIAHEDQEKTTFTCPFGTFAYRRMPFGL